MSEKWTDERLDDLNGKVGEDLSRVDADLRALRIETKTELVALRGEMNERFDRVDARFERVDARFDALQRTMVQAAIGLAAAFIAGFAALVGLVATQL